MDIRRNFSVITFSLKCNSLIEQTRVEDPSLFLNKQGLFKVIDRGSLILVLGK